MKKFAKGDAKVSSAKKSVSTEEEEVSDSEMSELSETSEIELEESEMES